MNTTKQDHERIEYPEAQFLTFEDTICVMIRGQRIPICKLLDGSRAYLHDSDEQEMWNLQSEMVRRASAFPSLLRELAALKEK